MPEHYDELGAPESGADLQYGVALDEDAVKELYGNDIDLVEEPFLPDNSYDAAVDEESVDAVEDALYEMAYDVGEALLDGEQEDYRGTIETDNGFDLEYEVGFDEDEDYADIAVTFADLPEGLHGFTDTSTDFVVINRNLYEFEREKTIEHEKEHQLNPHMPEWQIRHRVGGTDPEYSASVRREPRDIGDGSVSGYGCC
ncbi:MAG: hypothetical protein SVU32_00270 [Candidatus Nanohaloarchaea archaeon]|nr:hypothetical protein [Candidatus Nanohaloarchaea archaeon]